MTGFISITVTASSKDEAMLIADKLVTDKLAACVNIVPNVTSVYRWQGAVEKADEHMLLIKTRADYFGAVAACVKKLHSYKCPCIVGEALVAGDADYLHWLTTETTKSE